MNRQMNQDRPLPDIRRPPPPIPIGLGTKLFPYSELSFYGGTSVPTQMRLFSLKRRKEEIEGFEWNKADYYMDHRDLHSGNPRYCSTCSETKSSVRESLMEPVLHSHISSLKYRIDVKTMDHWGNFNCYSCAESWHSYKCGVRYPVLATSSTMAGWQGLRASNGYRGDQLHVDTVAIPGGHVQNVHHAVLAEFRGLQHPIDLVIVTGFNNLLDGQPPILVHDELQNFRDEILQEIPGSSVAICTLPFPPSMSLLPNDQYRNSRDLTDDIRELNFLIRDTNESLDQPMPVHYAPLFHTWGLKSTRPGRLIGPRNIMELLPSHRQQDWRERRPANQLHLCDRLRLRMGKSILRYFEIIYEL